MSANDKAAATYGRQPMSIAETLAVHEWDYDAKNDACCCKCNGWTGPGPSGDEENDTWERHVAEMLEPLIVGREQEASRQALNDAADAITESEAEAWSLGYTSGHSRAMRRMSDEPNVKPGTNPYRGKAEQ